MRVDVVEDELRAHVNHSLSWHEQVGGSTPLRLELTESAPVTSSRNQGLKSIQEEFTQPPEYVFAVVPVENVCARPSQPTASTPAHQVSRFEESQ